jgi:hypothetical protein
LIDAGAALDALFIIDTGGILLIDRNSFDFTGVLAGAFPIHNSAVRAHLGALAAFHTFCFVDMRLMFIVKGNRTAFANVLKPVSQAAPAGIGDLVAYGGAVITGNINYLNNVSAVSTAHRQFDAFGQNGPFLVNAAAHSGDFAGYNRFGNVQHVFQQGIIPGLPGYLPEHLVFQMLYLGIKLPHNDSLKITDFDAFPHLFQSFRQFLHQVHLDIEIDGKVGILVRWIDGFANIEIDISGFLEQQAADQ